MPTRSEMSFDLNRPIATRASQSYGVGGMLKRVAPFPAAAGGFDAGVQTKRRTDAFQASRQCDVFHQRNIRKAIASHKRFTRDEHRLVAGGDTGEA